MIQYPVYRTEIWSVFATDHEVPGFSTLILINQRFILIGIQRQKNNEPLASDYPIRLTQFYPGFNAC